MWSVLSILYTHVCVKCRQVRACSTVLLNQSRYRSIESADRDTMAASERAESSRGEIWENISTPASQIPAAPHTESVQSTRFAFCKRQAFNPVRIVQQNKFIQMLQKYRFQFEWSELSVESHLLKFFRQGSPYSPKLPHLERTLQQMINLGKM